MEWYFHYQMDELRHRIRYLKEDIERYKRLKEKEKCDYQRGMYAGFIIGYENELSRAERELHRMERIKAEQTEMTAV